MEMDMKKGAGVEMDMKKGAEEEEAEEDGKG